MFEKEMTEMKLASLKAKIAYADKKFIFLHKMRWRAPVKNSIEELSSKWQPTVLWQKLLRIGVSSITVFMKNTSII